MNALNYFPFFLFSWPAVKFDSAVRFCHLTRKSVELQSVLMRIIKEIIECEGKIKDVQLCVYAYGEKLTQRFPDAF